MRKFFSTDGRTDERTDGQTDGADSSTLLYILSGGIITLFDARNPVLETKLLFAQISLVVNHALT